MSSEYAQLLTAGPDLLDPSRFSELLDGTAGLINNEAVQRRALLRALNRRFPLPTSIDNLYQEALVLSVAPMAMVQRCAVSVSCLSRAGWVTRTADGRFSRAVSSILEPGDLQFIDSFKGDPGLPEPLLLAREWYDTDILLSGGLQVLLMWLEFGEAIAARFCLRFPSQVFDSAPSVIFKSAKIVRQVCRRVLRIDPHT